MNLNTIIFSYNRALQLDGVLQSLILHCSDISEYHVSVLFKADPEHSTSYQTLQGDYAIYDWIDFIKETDFHQDLVRELKGFDYILFLVDDNIFVQDFVLKDLITIFKSQKKAIGFSLRLGKNTTYCYTLNKDQSLPVFSPIKPSRFFTFNWVGSDHDFGYPLEVSSSIYRAEVILKILSDFRAHNPNNLELILANQASKFVNQTPELVCPKQSITFCVPVNKVQTVVPDNRAGEFHAYSAEELKDLFNQGYRINVRKYHGFTPNACHQEVPILFYNPSNKRLLEPLITGDLHESFPLRKELSDLIHVIQEKDHISISENVPLKSIIYDLNWSYQDRDLFIQLALSLNKINAVHGIQYLDDLLTAQREDWRFASFSKDNWDLVDKYLSGNHDEGPLVSVVMPVYNGERFLSEAIDSILNQTFKDFEFIIVDDGSTDKTAEIIRSYEDDRIVYCRNEKNSGIVKTLNCGLALAKGKYIARADADDISLPDRLKIQTQYMESNPNIMLYGSSMIIIDEEGKVLGEEIVPVVEEQIIRRLVVSCSFVHPSVMMWRDIIQKAGGYLSDRPHAEDYDLWCRMSLNFEEGLANYEKSLVRYRVNNDGVSNQNQLAQVNSSLLIGWRYLKRKTGTALAGSVYKGLYFAWLGDWQYWNENCLNECGLFFRWIKKEPIIQSRWKSFFKSLEHFQKRGKNKISGFHNSRIPQNNNSEFRVVAIMSAYNEADVIYYVIKDLIDQGILVYFIDHHSTDETVKIVSQFLGKGVIKIETFPEDSGFELPKDVYAWRYILRRKEDIVKSLGSGWYMHIDADEFRESPWLGISLYDGLKIVDSQGYNAVEFSIFDFKPVNNDFIPGSDVRKALRYYSQPNHQSDTVQLKCWKYYGQDFNLWRSGGHIIEFKGRRIFPIPFIMRHYPIRSQQHGIKKVFNERKTRWDQHEKANAWHEQYDGITSQNHNFLYDLNTLLEYRPEAIKQDVSVSDQTYRDMVSIIIPLYNQIAFTHKCIKAILKNTMYPNYELILVNNASTDDTHVYINELAKKYSQIRIIENEQNYRFAKACNQGASLAQGEYLVFLNNDTEVQKNWLQTFIQSYTEVENIGIMGARLLYANHTIQHAGIEFYPNSHPVYRVWPLHPFRGLPADHPEANRLRDVPAVTGACLLITKQLFQEIDGFDEEYGMYFEDTDLCFKVTSIGKRIVYNPEVTVYHYEGQSSPDQLTIDRLNMKAAARFFRKWRKPLGELAFRTLTDDVDDKFITVNKGINIDSNHVLDEFQYQIADHLASIIESLGPIYVHMGGIGDACLLLSTFYDRDPNQVILSIPNSIGAAKSFFSNFPELKKVIFIPYPQLPGYHALYRVLFSQIKSVQGMGATPARSYFEEWTSGVNVFNKYGLRIVNNWTRKFQAGKINEYQVVLNPCGSSKGMVGGKKNSIPISIWKKLIQVLNHADIEPIVIGVPEESKKYPAIGSVLDKRSYNFGEQMKLIASSDLLIGADTWGKTFAALCGIQTIVFRAVRPSELASWKDPAEFIFIDPWPATHLVKTFKEFKTVFKGIKKFTQPRTIISNLLKQLPVKGIENIHLAKSIYLFRNSGLGDVVMCLPLIKALKRLYPDKDVILATSRKYQELVSHSPLVSNSVSAESIQDLPATDDRIIFDLNQAKYGLSPIHEIDAFLYAFGLQLDHAEKQIYFTVDQARIQKVDSLLRSWMNNHPDQKLVVIHASKGDENRTWSLSNWNRLIDCILKDGYTVAVIGNTTIDESRGVHNFKRTDILNLVNRLDQLEVVELFNRADLFIATDSGPIQMAGASDIPIVGIYTVVSGEHRLPFRYGIQGWNAVAIESDCPYRQCYRYMADEEIVNSFMTANPSLASSIPQVFGRWCVHENRYTCLRERILPGEVWRQAKRLMKFQQYNVLIGLSTAEEEIRNQSYDRALDICQKLYQHTRNENALFGMGLSHYLLGDKEMAMSELKTLITTNPSHNIGNHLFNFLVKNTNRNLDIEQFLPLVKDVNETLLKKNMARRKYKQALQYVLKKDYPEALKLIKQALKLYPYYPEALQTLSEIMLELGFSGKAEKYREFSLEYAE